MRIDKLLSNLKYGSRTDVKLLLAQGRVRVNNQVVKQAKTHVDPDNDTITVDMERVFYKENLALILHKPSGYESSNVDGVYPSVLNLLKAPYNRFDWIIAGRLDADTEGLLLLLTNGDVAHQITSPHKHVYKRYFVKTRDKITMDSRFETGLELLDGRNIPYVSQPAKLTLVSEYEAYLDIKEGKFHQVKRMFEAIGNEVIYLKRVKIGNLELPGDLQLGEYREIETEIQKWIECGS